MGETGTNKEGKVWSVHMEAVNRGGHGGECKYQEGTLGKRAGSDSLGR